MRWMTLTWLGLIAACGSVNGESVLFFDPNVSLQTIPVVTRVTPTTGRAGDTITIFGLGFSIVPTDNLVVLSNTSIPASAYALVDPPVTGEIEQLTFTLPADSAIGDTSVVVNVYENSSNSDVLLTVTP